MAKQAAQIRIGAYGFDLTFGPLFTIICTAILAPIIVKLIGRKIDKSDAEKIEAIRKMEQNRKEEAIRLAAERAEAAEIKAQLDAERHSAVIGKIDGMCKRFDKVDNRFYDHEHIIEVDGKVYKSNGKITKITAGGV